MYTCCQRITTVSGQYITLYDLNRVVSLIARETHTLKTFRLLGLLHIQH